MIPLLLLLLLIVAFGVWGAIKLAFWVLLIALVVALLIGFFARTSFTRRGI